MTSIRTGFSARPKAHGASAEIVRCTLCGAPFSANSIAGATRRAVVHLIAHRPRAAQR